MFFQINILLLIATLLCTSVTGSNSDSGSFCQDCRSTVSYLQRFNSSNERDAFKEIFTNFCQIYYPSSTDYQKGPCNLIVNTAFYLIENTDPVHHCDQIGACTIQPGSLQLKPAVRPVKNVICDVCISSVESIKKQISDPASLHQLKVKLDALCEYLKVVDESQECKGQVVKVIDYLRNFAAQIDPEVYCESVQLCPVPPSRVSVIKFEASENSDWQVATGLPSLSPGMMSIISNFKPQLDSRDELTDNTHEPINSKHHTKGQTCLLCKFVFSKIQHALGNNRTRENIEKHLDKICSVVYKQGVNRDKCQEMIDSYSKDLIDILSEEMDPEMVCILIGECIFQKSTDVVVNDNQLEDMASDEIRRADTVEDLFVLLDPSLAHGSLEVCVECKLFIKYLQNEMKNPSSVAEMKAALERDFCYKLPTQSKDLCCSVIDNYAIDFFKAVAENLDPNQTCVNVGACKPRSNRPTFIESLTESLMKPDAKSQLKEEGVCDQCVEVIEKIDEYISKNDVNNDVNKIVDNVCKTLDASLVNKCTYIVETLGNELIKAIVNMDSPKDLCTKFYLC